MLPRALFTQSAWWLMIKEYWDLYCLGSKATLTIKTNNNMNTLNERSIVVGVDVHKYSHTAVAMNAWGEEKGDSVDEKRVGKVLLTKYEQTLPAKESIAEKRELDIARELDLLLMERKDLVRSKTIVKNQLHGLIHQQYTESYRLHCPRSFSKKATRWFLTDLKENETILAESIKRRLARLLFVEDKIYTISKEVAVIGERSKEVSAITTIHGCGMVTACSIMAEVITIKRFKNKHHFSSYAGISPTPHSSGRKNTMHTNPFGNRQLNRSLHTIALSQIAIKGDPVGKEYYQRKLKEGKTKLWALRCLKHQLAKVVFQKRRYC